MKKDEIIIVSAGGMDAIKPEILALIREKYGDDFIVIEPGEVKDHIRGKSLSELDLGKTFPIINTHCELPKLKTVNDHINHGPIGAILKNKKYR